MSTDNIDRMLYDEIADDWKRSCVQSKITTVKMKAAKKIANIIRRAIKLKRVCLFCKCHNDFSCSCDNLNAPKIEGHTIGGVYFYPPMNHSCKFWELHK